MNKILTTLFLALVSVNVVAGGDDEIEIRINESRAVIKEFATQLKSKLVKAIEEGGPENAIQVCHTAAPEIASTLSDKYDGQIGRTSLKTRNPKNNPDVWEQEVLEHFEQRQQEGADISKLDYFKVTEQGFRYMKPIPTQRLCLVCHGENIAEPLKAKLAELYPEDKATGFKEGDIRGAFTITLKK